MVSQKLVDWKKLAAMAKLWIEEDHREKY